MKTERPNLLSFGSNVLLFDLIISSFNIVKLSTYRYRQRFFNARKLAKDNGYKDVYINEDLTKFRNELLYQARKLVKAKCLLGAWSADGNILVRDDNKVHRITSESDLLPFQTTTSVE